MKTTIEVTSKREGQLLQQALADPEVRAYATVMGALLALPTERVRKRVMASVTDRLAEEAERAKG